MSINIKGATGKTSPQTSLNKTGKNAKAAKSKPQGASAGQEDSVDLTDAATQLQKIESSLASLPIVDSDRVAGISESIKQGEYEVNEEKIAERIIKNEQLIK